MPFQEISICNCNFLRFVNALLSPGPLHDLNFMTGLHAVDHLSAFGLCKAFFNVSSQPLAFLIAPTFFGVLSLKSPAQHILGVRIRATGKAFVD